MLGLEIILFKGDTFSAAQDSTMARLQSEAM